MLPANPTITEIFEHLLDGERIILSFPDRCSFQSIYSQLRAAKSKYDTNYSRFASDSITNGNVVRYLESSESSSIIKVTFFLGPPIRTLKPKKFTILPQAIPSDSRE